ncbi:thioredoxin domain-containing protein [Niabella yanshanensis]|uniref:Thioredoxin domain-containing protein n=1 Tax=Niabella yanshanensis TaxID=577386 RepID=A0ABZ0WAS0_9BACT|nr:thioredoxin domain-containing protein [Niabella yanshanensis]WQD40388.1 thioredoxin domain-containing protein [Niabella yanshanensis]
MPNALINETSPYLLQHAHNPVNWYPWGEEALQKAIAEDKPILVSIGYAACHWCHVMERESFEDEATAALMNEHFINIKIDREERPDLDHIYMDAVQAMAGSGGWPLNAFLTPGKKPFYGGTYFPPKAVMNRPSWKEVLTAVSDAFKNQRADIEDQANGLTQHLFQANSFGINANEGAMKTDQIDMACENLLKQADQQWGGFGAAPKFPQTFSIQFLLRYYTFEKERNTQLAEDALKQALLSLDKMIEGGIYDQIGGGFARYSTDPEWLAPHFEKMLYDNALLVTTLSEAYAITKNEYYKRTIEHTLTFVERELLDPSNGFYAALDADSEGEEGKYYVWQLEEVQELLGPDAAVYCDYYNISANGNWSEGTSSEEHKNILRILEPLPVFAANRQYKIEDLQLLLDQCNAKLLKAREERIKPALDDKIILSWNALMNTAYSKAYAATGNKQYRQKAISNMEFLLSAFQTPEGNWQHVWKNGTAKYTAFLDDHAYLIQALLQLHKITTNRDYLVRAKELCEKVIAGFSEPDGYFYYTPEQQTDVIVRKKEVYDGATPSGNSVMAQNLLELGLLLDQREWRERSFQMTKGLSTVAVKYPTSFGVWLAAAYQQITGTKEIVLMGNFESALRELLAQPLFHSVIMAARQPDESFPLLKDKTTDQELALFLCENYACQRPVFSVNDLLKQLYQDG